MQGGLRMGKRSITDEEIGLIKAMLARGMANKAIQFYFNRQDRAVNSGRISGIKHRGYGPEVPEASDEALSAFIRNFETAELAAPGIVAETAPPSPQNAIDEKLLRSFFAKGADGIWRCTVGETDQHECKEGFNLRSFGRHLKTMAGFANNRGGYLFFGVKDKPEGFAVCGLKDDRFTDTDQNKFSQTIRAALAPTPRFRVTTLIFGAMTVGVIHVEAHGSKPVIAGKTEGELIEGFIYYRYSGETRAICYADLRSILDERDRQSRESIMPMVQRLLELGPHDAMVANLADGQLEGGRRSILIDPQSLEQIKFIREGYFDEVDGAPTLRVIGDAQIVPPEMMSQVRTVREEVTVAAILRNFLSRNPVEQPLSYFSQASHEQGWILPIFYYLHLAGQPRNDAINSLKSSKNAKPKTRTEFTKLLQGKRTIFENPGGKRLTTLKKVRAGAIVAVSDLETANDVANALSGITSEDSVRFDHIHDLLMQCHAIWESIDGDSKLLPRIRRAAARLDELEYGPMVSAE